MTHAWPFVALGGALGASLRHLATILWPAPWGVVAVNVFGSFLIGVLSVRLSPVAAPLLLTGVLGGFTTFSAFSLDALRLLESGRLGAATLYVGASVVLSLLACAAGSWLGRLA
jgi:CrcB protein